MCWKQALSSLCECQCAAAVTVPGTGPAGSLSLFFSIATEVGTSSSLSREHLGDFSSVTRQPTNISGDRRQSSYCSVSVQTWAYLFQTLSVQKAHTSVPQIKCSPVTCAVLSTEDIRTSWGDVKWSLPKQNSFRHSSILHNLDKGFYKLAQNLTWVGSDWLVVLALHRQS